ncbi:hypothetical protein ACS0TY_004281 [Phlomoides rotata]
MGGPEDVFIEHGGDSSIKRVKVEQEFDQRFPLEVDTGEKCVRAPETLKHVNSSEAVASTSNGHGRTENSGHHVLPKEMNEMKIRDDKTDVHEENGKDTEATIVSVSGTETGQIIMTSIGGQNGQPKQTVSFMAERVVGTGSFGVVYQAKHLEIGEAVAIKKVLQDRRYKNRELQIVRLLNHPNVVQLKHFFLFYHIKG